MNNFIYYITISFLTLTVSFLFALRIFFLKSSLSFRIKDNVVAYSIAGYFIIFFILSLLKYGAYNMAMVDLGRISQAIWNTLGGRFLVNTWEFGNANRMIAHSELIYLLIAPIYLIYPNPKTILVLQTLIISLGALGIYWLGKKWLKNNFVALCFSVSYLFYPSLQYGNLSDFHPDMMATTFLIFTFYYAEDRKWGNYFLFLMLSLICKEYVSLILVALGIYVIFIQKNIKVGIITSLLGAFWFVLTYKIIPACLLQGKENLLIYLYGPLGSSIKDIFWNITMHPWQTTTRFVTVEKMSNLALLLLPVGFLPLLNPAIFMISLPIIAGLILSPLFSYTNHHNGTIIPFIFISSLGLARFVVKNCQHKFKNISYSMGIFVFSCSLLSSIFYGPSPLSWRFWDKSSYRYWNNLHQFNITAHDKLANSIAKLIPDKVSVSSSNHLGSHLIKREFAYHFPFPKDFEGIDYIFVDILEYTPFSWTPRIDEIKALRSLLVNKEFELIVNQDGIMLFKRGYNENGYKTKLEIVSSASPRYLVNLSFDNRLLLLGYDFNFNDIKIGSKCRIAYYWQVLEDFDQEFSHSYFGNVENLNKNYVLIDTIENKDNKLRIVHLPTYILYPPREWKAGDVIKEDFEFGIPEDFPVGNYKLKIGLYVAPELFFIQTDSINVVPETKEIMLRNIQIEKNS